MTLARAMLRVSVVDDARPQTWIVAYDFSAAAYHAIEIAAQMLADKGGGRLLVVHAHSRDTEHALKIVDPERDVPSLELDFAYVREARQQLAEDLAGIAAPSGVSIEGRLLAGRPASVVSRVAREEGASLILVGHLREHEGVLPGGVAHGLLTRAECPVLVVKGEA